MKSELTDLSPTRKEIKIEIEPAVVRETYDRVSDRFARQVKVPGFRPGHAPRSVVRTRFKSEIRAEAIKELLPEAVDQAIREHAPGVIGEPQVELDNSDGLEKFGEAPISVKVNVEVLPKIELADYKGIEAVRRTRPISEANVDETLEALRESSASMQPVEDRPSEIGDTVTVSLDGKFVDAPEQENIKAEDIEITLGGPGVQAEFTENLTGVKADDEKVFSVSYPSDYQPKDLAGQNVEYTAKVLAVRLKELPEVDDEWARSLGDEFDSIATLREKIQADLEKRAGYEADHRLRAELIRKLLEANKFEVPQTLVDQQANYRLETVVRDMMARGFDPRSAELNWDGAREELKSQAEEDVRSTMLLERIAEQENLEVSKEEIEAEIVAIARNAQQPVEQVRNVLTKDGGERSIAHKLRSRKALDLLVEKANVTEEPWSEETEKSGVRIQNSDDAE